MQSQGKGKRITKNYVGGLGNTSYGEMGERRRFQEKENMNRMNESCQEKEKMNRMNGSWQEKEKMRVNKQERRGREEEAIKGSFEKLNEE